MTTAGPVVTRAGFTYEIEATTDTCGDVTFTAEPGTPYEGITGLNGWADWGSCTTDAAEGGVELLTVQINDRTLRWTFGLKSTPLKVGTVFRDFRARVDPSNPVVPFPSSATGIELGLVDAAKGTGTWRVG